MSFKKENKDYKLMNDEVVRPLFKNSSVAKELTAKVVSLVLKLDYNEVYNNIEFISEDMLFSAKTIDGRTDLMLETNKYYVNIEFNYTNGSTRDKQMESYIFEIFFKQAIKTENYKNMKNIIQIMIENYDYFHEGKFIYEVGLMEKELGIPEDDLITKYHISLESLKNIDYNSIKYERDALKKILYMFVCEETKLDEAYKGDTFMEEVIDVAKAIADKKKIPLYLSESEIRRLDREEAVEEGYASGYDSGKSDGIEQKQTEMIINMYEKNIDNKTIADVSNISIDEVKKIIESKAFKILTRLFLYILKLKK